ncbi:uncharacterized protein LOC128274825 [Anopheles cruzii]|uniref:uncharacterized protein LOC128274825 n=1 Tax=Anopheles cruzii TaxID=68878 RepID=UPI0022EC3D14|nr:uncharacterized protein LOC128274825 [Anopheles cruzii]
MYYSLVIYFVVVAFAHRGDSMRINMTMFSNCQDVNLPYESVPISVETVRYDRDADGVCNTLHAEYEVRESSDHVDWELIITTYKCPLQNSVTCLENPREHIEPMHCDRFHSDDSGPWFMLASAMIDGDRCGRVTGRFNLDTAVMKIKYLDQYVAMGEGTYRVRMMFHIPGTSVETLNVRGCCEMDFDVIQ